MCENGIICPEPLRVSLCWEMTSTDDVLTVLNKEVGYVEFALIGHAKGSEGDEVHGTVLSLK